MNFKEESQNYETIKTIDQKPEMNFSRQLSTEPSISNINGEMSPVEQRGKDHGSAIISDKQKKSLSDSKYIRWTSEEDKKLKEIVISKGSKNWNKIAEYFENKNSRQCMYRWYKVLKPCLKLQGFEEIEQNFSDVCNRNRKSDLSILDKSFEFEQPSLMSNKKAFQNFSDVNSFTIEDELALLLLVTKIGTAWSKLTSYFPGKSENFLKNKCYCILRKKVGRLLGTDRVKQMKATELMSYLSQALEDRIQRVGSIAYASIRHKIFPQQCEDVHKNEQTGKIEINLCNDCLIKLKLRLKKKILEKIVQKKVMSSLSYGMNVDVGSPSSNFSI
jgi:hypothetical protein